MSDGRLHFTFHQCLGKGGFGEVYLATMRRPGGLEQRVAVKVLKEDLHNRDEAVKRLKDEGRMLATLEHPTILNVVDLVRLDGRVALVTEYVDGVDCARLCKRGRQAPERVVVGVIRDVASALDAAWSRESPETGRPLHLIHRDIKPENIRISSHGIIKLLDFGIARTTELERNAKTAIGDLPFTPGYAPPEAFVRGIQGREADVYALAASAYRMLAAERLYQGMALGEQVKLASFRDEYEPWLEKRLERLDVAADLRTLLRAMLAYDPGARPTAGEVHEIADHLFDELMGPSPARWARHNTLPPPPRVDDATLNGRELLEDPPVPSVGLPRALPTTPSFAREGVGDPKSIPPPVPRGLKGAKVPLRQQTADTTRSTGEPTHSAPGARPLRSMYSMAPLNESEAPEEPVLVTVGDAPAAPPRSAGLPAIAWIGLALGVVMLLLGAIAVAVALAMWAST